MPGETKTTPTPSDAPFRETDWQDFRDHIPTADKDGRRVWIYPRKPDGRLYTARKLVGYALFAFLLTGPFLKINGNPVLLFDIVGRRFSILGQVFWPQDMFLFALAMLIGFVMLVLFTAVYGRVWCGWLCPQTVLMELLFRRLEYWIEGDAPQQRRLAAAPWTGATIAKRALKHGLFLAISFVIANLLLGFVIGGDALLALIAESPLRHPKGFAAMGLFTLLFYGIFARFREQACTFVCPYGRLQSVLLDENSIVVSYDHPRGEPRAKPQAGQSLAARKADARGDCVDCGLCVAVCPTGIDIRNGTQMECVNCTACIDACDSIMDRMKLPRGLVRFASAEGIQNGTPLRVTPRMVAYTVVLVLLTALLAVMMTARAELRVDVTRMRGSLYQAVPDGRYANLYTLKARSKRADDLPLEVRVEAPADGRVQLPGGALVARGRELTEAVALIDLPAARLTGQATPLVLGVYAGERKLQTIKTTFLGPGGPPP